MNAKTKAAVIRHGEQLLAIFPNAKERDPVKLCSKLRKLERRAEALALRLCNGPEFPNENDVDKIGADILAKVNAVLGNVETHVKRQRKDGKCGTITEVVPSVPIFVNRDPRGYALKIESGWMTASRRLHRDMGGYGIIAPDLTED